MSRMQVVLDPIDASLESRRAVTRDEYRAFCEANPELRVERTADGKMIVMPPAHSRSGDQNAELIMQLRTWAKLDGTGMSYDSSAGFDLPNGSNRSPDASWILKTRIQALRPEQREGYMEICPDFVAELRSSSDRLRELHDKMREYLNCGARLGWLIDPLDRRVWIYRPGEEVETLEAPLTLTAGPLMPGFVLDLGPIWNPEF